MKQPLRIYVLRLIALIATLPTLSSAQQQAETHFSSQRAVAVAVEGLPACLNWCVVGVCYWLRCTLWMCDVETTLRISHRYPDLVVTAWTADLAGGQGGNPYVDADALYGSMTYRLGVSLFNVLSGIELGGGQSTPKDFPAPTPEQGGTSIAQGRASPTDLSEPVSRPEEQRHRNLRFKSAMAVGHPMDAINSSLVGDTTGVPALCPSESTPYNLYYSSEADAPNWRTGFVDLIFPESYLPGMAEVGIPRINEYGNIYPRTGFLVQPVDYKAAAVAAQRAVDIVTRPMQPRIYQELNSLNYPIWAMPPPGPSTAQLFDRWQMIAPIPDAACYPFGIENEDFGRNTSQGAYGWNFWQTYQCCINNEGAIFLFFTLFQPMCQGP